MIFNYNPVVKTVETESVSEMELLQLQSEAHNSTSIALKLNTDDISTEGAAEMVEKLQKAFDKIKKFVKGLWDRFISNVLKLVGKFKKKAKADAVKKEEPKDEPIDENVQYKVSGLVINANQIEIMSNKYNDAMDKIDDAKGAEVATVGQAAFNVFRKEVGSICIPMTTKTYTATKAELAVILQNDRMTMHLLYKLLKSFVFDFTTEIVPSPSQEADVQQKILSVSTEAMNFITTMISSLAKYMTTELINLSKIEAHSEVVKIFENHYTSYEKSLNQYKKLIK